MKPSELKNLIIGSLDEGADPEVASEQIEKEGISFDFSNGFSDRVIARIFTEKEKITNEIEFIKTMRITFNRVALTGVAAIVLLLLSIFLAEGSLSINSFLGIGNTYDESTICLITGY